MVAQRTLLAPELYAHSQGSRCEGKHECHWCGAPCGRIYIHDGPPPLPFVKNDLTARRPANPYICNGCRLFRRPRNSIRFLNSTDYQDGQSLMNFSFLVTETGLWGIRKEDHPALWDQLLRPPSCFVLSLVDPGTKNYLQLAFVNDFQQIRADTPLRFTYNNVPHSYTVYDLKNSLQSGEISGREAGVRVLMEILDLPVIEKRGRGRPTNEERNDPQRVITDRNPVRRSA